jgi:hypothetical protein
VLAGTYAGCGAGRQQRVREISLSGLKFKFENGTNVHNSTIDVTKFLEAKEPRAMR